MKRFSKKLLYFVLFFGLFFILINFFFLGIIALTDWDCKKRLESLKFDNPDFDLLILGDSFAEYGVDTELMTSQGIKSYNLSLVGNSVWSSYIQLNEYLTKYSKRPRYVILAINSYLDRFDAGITVEPIVEFTMKDHKYGVKDIPVSKFRWLGVEILKKIVSSKHRKARLSYGQIKWEKNTPDYSKYNELYLNTQKYESSDWVGEIAKLCSLKGIKFIIIDIPSIKEAQNLSGFGPYTIYFNNGYSAVLYNCSSRDFCSIFDADKDWIGQSHLNEVGAAKFTKELISIVKRQNTDSQ